MFSLSLSIINKMNKEFIPYEQALALKELGFDKPCFGYFYHENMFTKCHPKIYHSNTFTECDTYEKIPSDSCKVPLYQQAFRFFREKYGLYHSVGLDNSLENDVNCDYQIINHNQSISEFETDFKSYEEADLACLKKLIGIVKNK